MNTPHELWVTGDTPSGLLLDPVEAGARQKSAARKYSVVTVPTIRLLGLSAISIAVVLHHWLIGPAVSTPVVVAFLVGAQVYCLASWALLASLWDRLRGRLDVPFLLLGLDMVACVAATYVTGAERSLLFFLIALRLSDSSIGARRTLALAHLAPLLYLAMLWYVARVDGHAVPFGVAAVNAFTLYGTALYFTLIGRTAALLRERIVQAARVSRVLVAQLEEKSERLRLSIHQANAASRSKARFLATVSHELRTPITAIIAQTEMVIAEADPAAHAPIIRDLAPVVSAARELSGVVDTLLEVSGVETDRSAPQLEVVDVADLIQDVIADFRLVIEQSGNTFQYSGDSDLGALRTDRSRLRHVLLILLGNAAKFTSRGTVRLAVTRGADAGRPVVVFRVSDTGIGIAEDVRDTLFHPFVQADASSTRQYGGAGLGLAIAKRYTELISSELSYETDIGVGTTFTLVVPRGLEDDQAVSTCSHRGGI